jgi:hypothetical protein
MLGNIHKSFEGHVVTQHYPKQGTENPLQRGCQGLTYSGLGGRFSLHDFGIYIPKKYGCQSQGHLPLKPGSACKRQAEEMREAANADWIAARQKNDPGALAPRRFVDTLATNPLRSA